MERAPLPARTRTRSLLHPRASRWVPQVVALMHQPRSIRATSALVRKAIRVRGRSHRERPLWPAQPSRLVMVFVGLLSGPRSELVRMQWLLSDQQGRSTCVLRGKSLNCHIGLERVVWFWPTRPSGDVSQNVQRLRSVLIRPSIAHGLWGHAKFIDNEAAPFASLVC